MTERQTFLCMLIAPSSVWNLPRYGTFIVSTFQVGTIEYCTEEGFRGFIAYSFTAASVPTIPPTSTQPSSLNHRIVLDISVHDRYTYSKIVDLSV